MAILTACKGWFFRREMAVNPPLPRWALDGGNGLWPMLDPMTNEEIAKCWNILKAMLSMWGYSELQASDLVEFMDALEQNIQ